ncbi:putative polyketide synthase [Melanomma pulvis-pyrius CBS 109.77]|uniref:Putative polyketide synthase n=1 Tax=Melanomma pulvis-pyrius CBS 109.77 TaxID=1314802 RepID=A0A6A6WXA6_9PLEO|nr:putative polyketide synthase [Melanomma pulvis-pyrius CBS 109.77]
MTPSRFDSVGLHDARSPEVGYFLDENLSNFDPALFKLSRSELENADPQQRQLLEVTRECLENAGEVDYRGRSIGCYVGTFGDDWMQIMGKDTQLYGGFDFRGTVDAMLANRVSYEFDLKGPSMVIKTGCSASLVCLHEATRALQYHDCDAAIVAGCNLLMGTALTDALSHHGVLSPDVSCKSFDVAANGYARAEAINCIYIKRLSDAIRDGNPIRAIIRGTGTNNDGNSHGITMPNGKAHEALMRKVYRDCGLDPGDTAYVECHTTGTQVGDPIETAAVGNVFGKTGMLIGSVKPNVGHSEGASALTSIIKAVLILEKGIITPQIKYKNPNPKIPLLGHGLEIALKATPLPHDRAKRISVNSYGIGGSNAHVIIETWSGCDRPPRKVHTPSPRLLVFSAGTQKTLDRIIVSHQEYLKSHPDRLEDLSYTMALHREKLTLRAYAVAEPTSNSFTASEFVKKPNVSYSVVMVFSGQGAHWPGMAKELIRSDPNFRNDLRSLDGILRSLQDGPQWAIEEELEKAAEASLMHLAEYSQPLCTAIQIALVNAYARLGILPNAVIGHSSGEIAAAYASGGISMRDAIVASYYRGLATRNNAQGGMAAIGLSKDVVSKILVGNTNITIACENGPSSVTIAGAIDELEVAMESIRRQEPDALVRRLIVDTAYHSHHMRSIAPAYLERMQSALDEKRPSVQLHAPMFSTVVDTQIKSSAALTPDYWCANLCSSVEFYSATKRVLQHIPNPLFLEIGPHSTLAGPLKRTCVELGSPSPYIPTLLRNKNSNSCLLLALGQLYQHHVDVDYTQLFSPGNVLTDLPTYPWDHAPFAVESRMLSDWRLSYHTRHPLLGQRSAETTNFDPSWRVYLAIDDEPWIRDHKVGEDVLFPFAGYIALAIEASQQLSPTGDNDGYSLRQVVVHTAMVIRGPTIELVTTLRRVRITDYAMSDWYEFSISSYYNNAWIQHCHGEIKPVQGKINYSSSPLQLEKTLPASAWYSYMEGIGMTWGPEFQLLSSISCSPTVSKVSSTIEVPITKSRAPFYVHPCTMDQAFQLILLAYNRGLTQEQRLFVPTILEELYISRSLGNLEAVAWASDESVDNQVDCFRDGQLIFQARNIHTAPLDITDDVSAGDRHAAASLHWYPDLDFATNNELFDPVQSATDGDSLIEEMTILCVIDSAHILQDLAPAKPHFIQYRAWLEARISHLQRETGTDASGYSSFLELTGPERAQAISQRFDILCQIPSKVAVATGLKKTQENAVEMFTGGLEILELLTQDGVLADLYTTTSFDCGKYVAALSNKTPTLRILEVGAGTGGTTEKIIQAISAYTPRGTSTYVSYTFTDISPGFFPQAKERFCNSPNFEYRVLDISRSPLEQGFDAGSYDLIIAANVIHATPSLKETLTNLRLLLREDGYLVFSELCTTSLVPGYVFGWFSGWWLGADDNRPDQPFISLERWEVELKGAGFFCETSTVDREYPYEFTALIVARRNECRGRKDSSRSVTVLCKDADSSITRQLVHKLQESGVKVLISFLGENLSEATSIISTLDMETPTFSNITEATLQNFQRTLESIRTKTILWVMPPVQLHCTEPTTATSLGVLRTARVELGIPITTLEVPKDECRLVEFVSSVFDRISSLQSTDTLSPDMEYIVDDGLIKIGRYHPFSLESERRRKREERILVPGIIALDVEKPGLLDSVRWVEKGQPPPTLNDCEVEIYTRAVGINFHDMAPAMGIISHGSGDIHLAVELSGIVSRVGPLVDHVVPGDRIFGMASGGMLASVVRLPSALVVKIPDELSFEDAATMGCHATAIHSLIDIGRIEAGQTILVHSACGGVGHAALQLCKAIGIDTDSIFTTVGNSGKADYLTKTFGIRPDHIFDSHNDSFLDNLMQATAGRGVDVVLNSLSGDLLHASWNCVAEFGTMIELSRRDLAESGKLSLKNFLANRSYSCVQLAHIIEKAPRKTARLLSTTLELYRQKKITPIRPVKIYAALDAHLALRRLQHPDHMGKVVVRFPEDAHSIPHLSLAPGLEFESDASYLLVGGLGGLGRVIAIWMARHGARHLVMLSRNAWEDPRHQKCVNELEELGCSTIVVKGSVENPSDVEKTISASNKPIRGVMHLAMVLRDSPIFDMTISDWEQVQGPKVKGAWNLHEAFPHADSLDFFILASSLTTVDEMPGQSNYCSANTWLEGFCQYRRSLGLAATALSIGAIEDIGFLAENTQAERNMRSRGQYFLSSAELLDFLELAILSSRPELSTDGSHIVARPWETTGHIITGLRPDPVRQRQDRRLGYYHNTHTQNKTKELSSGDRLQEFIADARKNVLLLDEDTSVKLLAEEIGRRIFAFMLKSEEEVNFQLSIASMGLDSLVSIELRRWWKQVFSLDTSTLEIMGSGTLLGLGQLAANGLRERFSDLPAH